MKRLDEMLEAYSKQDYYAFHMPGHKRQVEEGAFSNPFSMDITEIEGFDNLHHPIGVIKEAQERAARLYGAKETYYCINGSTAGILSAISAAVTRGGTLLMARNCHKAVYHAAYLRELHTEYVYPQEEKQYGLNGPIAAIDIQIILEKNPKVEAVIITSPSYDGVISDVAEIAKVVHAYDIPLIVDAAHGAHLGFHPYFPESVIKLGADVVIHSLHKTMPCLTQTALVHQNSDRVSSVLLQRFLGIYQSSSPSYLLMGSMDRAIGRMEEVGSSLFTQYAEKLASCRKRLEHLQHLEVVPTTIKEAGAVYDMDPSKLIIATSGSNLSGKELYDILVEKYHLQLEMAAQEYALAMTSVMDSQEGLDRLCRALEEIDQGLLTKKREIREQSMTKQTVSRMTITQALERKNQRIETRHSIGRACAEYVYLYPPGIPLLVPGEQISREILEDFKQKKQQGFALEGLQDGTLESIRIVQDEEK